MKRVILPIIFLFIVFMRTALAHLDLNPPRNELPLIITSIETLDGAPVTAHIFDCEKQLEFEYSRGDYVRGKLIREILADRVVLLDEVTNNQYVIIYDPGVVEPKSEKVKITRLRRRARRNEEGMDVTKRFNAILSKIRGEEKEIEAVDEFHKEISEGVRAMPGKSYEEMMDSLSQPVMETNTGPEARGKSEEEKTGEVSISSIEPEVSMKQVRGGLSGGTDETSVAGRTASGPSAGAAAQTGEVAAARPVEQVSTPVAGSIRRRTRGRGSGGTETISLDSSSALQSAPVSIQGKAISERTGETSLERKPADSSVPVSPPLSPETTPVAVEPLSGESSGVSTVAPSATARRRPRIRHSPPAAGPVSPDSSSITIQGGDTLPTEPLTGLSRPAQGSQSSSDTEAVTAGGTTGTTEGTLQHRRSRKRR